MKTINKKTFHRRGMSAWLLICLVLVAIFSIMPIFAYAETSIPDATNQFYVNDFADVFTDTEETKLVETAVALAEGYDGIQVVVTTITSLEGDSIEHYAIEMYNKYGIGKDDKGLLILLSTGDREIYVATGLGMEAYINDSKTGRFIDDYAISYLANNKFNEGLINLQEAFVKEIITCIQKEIAVAVPESSESAITETEGTSKKSGLDIFIICCYNGVIFLLLQANLSNSREDTFKKNQIADLESQLEKERENSKAQKDSFNSQLQEIRDFNASTLDSLNSKLENSKHEYELLQGKYTTLVDRFKRAETLHPGIDKEITDMINEEIRQKDMELAQAVNAKLQGVVSLTADKNLVARLKPILDDYNELTNVQKSYVTADISKVNALYCTSCKLKKDFDELQELKRCKANATRAQNSISNIIRNIHVGQAANLQELKRAQAIYFNLDFASKRFFDSAIAREVDRLLYQAQSDQNRIEAEEAARRHREEERRRAEERHRREQEEAERKKRSSSQSSSHHSTSYHGFGGRSGGGGAGRKF